MSKKMSFVMPVYHKEARIEVAIRSLQDQDYLNWECICVLDGKDRHNKKAEKIIKRLAREDERITYFYIPHAGACAARNAGAEDCKGDYVSFFSPDFILFPGMLRKWIESFADNAYADFIYGGYRFINSSLIMPAEDFDPFTMRNYPYIDGGMPMKKKVWEDVRWDVNFKSLNDWEFWVHASEKGFKGHKIPEFSYAAEIPQPKGLSYDSHYNWIDRVKAIKQKHGIPENPICVTSLGARLHAIRMAKILGADFHPMPSIKPHEYKMIYLLGFYASSADQHARVFLDAMTGKLNTKVKKAIHWIGGDTWMLRTLPFDSLKRLTGHLNEVVDYHLCETEEAKAELIELGIKNPKIVPIPFYEPYDIYPLPKKLTVAIHVPGEDIDPRDKYLRASSYYIAKKLRNVKFLFYGDERHKGKRAGNIEYCGLVNFEDFGKRCSAMVKLVKHDSPSQACWDFVRMGRKVYTNIPMAGTTKIDLPFFPEDVETAKAAKSIIKILKQEKAKYPFNNKAKSFKDKREKVLSWLNQSKYKKSIYRMMGAIV